MNPRDLGLLANAVQTNCHIADARHAADMTLCIYLLQMREFYRWEEGIAPMHSLSHDAVGSWLTAREALWDQLEDSPWHALVVNGQSFDPFDVLALNRVLQPQGLVYGAGLSGPGRATFFLGALSSVQQREGVPLWVSGRDNARSLSSPPAALADNTIFLRQESLQRWVWEKYETWTMRRPGGAFKSALDAYGYATDGEQALERMAQAQAETLILHELGEARVASLLGPDWADMRGALGERRTELYARAARPSVPGANDCLHGLASRRKSRIAPSPGTRCNALEGSVPASAGPAPHPGSCCTGTHQAVVRVSGVRAVALGGRSGSSPSMALMLFSALVTSSV